MRFLSLAMLAAAAVAPALARSDSAYTKIMTPDAKCIQVEMNEEEGWAVSKCPGYKGIDVWVGEGDLRAMVGYGKNGNEEMAYQRTFPLFNPTGETVELVRRHHDPHFTLDSLPPADDATADLLMHGLTVGVFQCESTGAQRTLRQLRARTVRDLRVS